MQNNVKRNSKLILKKLSDILYKVSIVEIIGSTDVTIAGLAFDSRKVDIGFLFIATKGLTVDGHSFIQTAIDKGAKAVLCEEIPENHNNNNTYIKVADSTKALAFASANFYDNPSQKIKLVGVTGTNGKTTIANLLHNLFEKLGYKAGLLSTVVNKIHNTQIQANYTTPDSLEINRLLDKMVQTGCDYCFMEVSSHAMAQNRVEGLQFAGGIFTNITHDHLDYHKTFAEYLAAKKRFFDELPASAFAITNGDDKNGKIVLQNTKAKKHTYALKSMADYKGKILENRISGLHMLLNNTEVWFKLVGDFNAYNLLAIYGAAVLLEQDNEEVLKELTSLNSVEGRFDYVKSQNNITAIVDYAHTPDALENVLKTINGLRDSGEDIITVVGCGGDRDSAKRPVMAKISCKYSQRSIFTSDNPRSEDPEKIIQQMMEGVDIIEKRKVLEIVNRREAIKTAVALAKPGDIILIAGKGHEKYQEINGVRNHFDDKEIVKEFLNITN